MPYEVEVKRSAAKSLERIPVRDRHRLVARMRALADDPRPAGARHLVGEDAWRIRQGDYRIVYLVDDRVRVVAVTKIDHRRDIYRRF